MRLLVPLTLITAIGVGAYFLLAPNGPHWRKLTGPAPEASAQAPSSAPAVCACAPHGMAPQRQAHMGHYAYALPLYRPRRRGPAVYHHLWQRYDWNMRRAEQAQDIYDYSAASRSHIEYGVGADTGEAWVGTEKGNVIEDGGDQHRGSRHGGAVWVDGFGRAHAMQNTALQPGSEIDSRERLSPYHFYGDDDAP